MKKVLIAAAALSLTFGSSCTKQTSTLPPVTDTVYLDTHQVVVPLDTSTTISGIKDIIAMPWSTFSLPIMVNRNSGLEQKVTMMISGVPENVDAKFSSESGYTSFSTSLEVEARFVKRGTYPLVIASKTEKGKTSDYTVNLTVDTMTKKECNQMVVNNVVNSFSTVDSTIDSVVYTGTNMYPNQTDGNLYFRNLILRYDANFTQRFLSYSPMGSLYHVKLMFDCETGTLTIPEHEIEGRSFAGNYFETFTISGTGKIDLEKETFEITYTTSYDDGGNTVTSTYTVTGVLQ